MNREHILEELKIRVMEMSNNELISFTETLMCVTEDEIKNQENKIREATSMQDVILLHKEIGALCGLYIANATTNIHIKHCM